ncbi:flagellar hook capping FlgD N-terminal domain-containing protein [Cellulomonas soli]|uniref:flagellar hook capping FlgD N-terminal domain-containing protein n=1 Tax=Cellulomonas soli TaxID=931535 RepID=UPI003F874AD4
MSTDIPVSYLTTTRQTATSTDTPNELSSQDFLELMIAQLRNQDPSSPMDSSALMQQTTQMSTMESLIELTSTSREQFAVSMRMAAANLVGQTVSWADADGVAQTGVVDSVSYAGAVPTVLVGGKEIALDSVASVKRTTSTTTA